MYKIDTFGFLSTTNEMLGKCSHFNGLSIVVSCRSFESFIRCIKFISTGVFHLPSSYKCFCLELHT